MKALWAIWFYSKKTSFKEKRLTFKGGNSKMLLLPLSTVVYSKIKEFAPEETILPSYSISPFSKGLGLLEGRPEVKKFSFCKIGRKKDQSV